MTSHFNSSKSDTIAPYILANGQKLYFEKCIAFMEKKGRQKYGEHFKIYEEDHEIIFKLLVYFIRDEEAARRLDLDLNKGIFLSGPVGCGKTSLMKLCKEFARKELNYTIKPCREIALEFAQQGYDCLFKYISKSSNQNRLRTYCFDDLGTEQNIRYYGNECNVMGEILLSRSDHFVENKSITHITTNLNASDIEKFYGNRVRSRMREMFNIIPFDKNSRDKRR